MATVSFLCDCASVPERLHNLCIVLVSFSKVIQIIVQYKLQPATTVEWQAKLSTRHICLCVKAVLGCVKNGFSTAGV